MKNEPPFPPRFSRPALALAIAALAVPTGLAACAKEAAHPPSSGAPNACGVAPMKLVMEMGHGAGGSPAEKAVVLDLRADGLIVVTPDRADPSRPPLPLKLRSPGCIELGGGLMLEYLPDGRIWHRISGSDVRLEGARLRSDGGSATIEPDGRIVMDPAPPIPLTYHLEDYEPAHACAGALLLYLWNTFPSSGGSEQPPDAASRCAPPR